MEPDTAVADDTDHVEGLSGGPSSREGGEKTLRSNSKSPTDGHEGRAGTPLEGVSCNGTQLRYKKAPEPAYYSKLKRKEPTSAGLELTSTRVTVYPQQDLESWNNKRDYTLPKLGVLKVRLDDRWACDELGDTVNSFFPPGSMFPSRGWSREPSRTGSADSYFRQGGWGSRDQHGLFQSRTQMEKAFNTFGNSRPLASSSRPHTSAAVLHKKPSPSTKDSTSADRADSKSPLAWYSAPNRQKVVRKSPPWRSLMNRRPQGVRSDKTNLCPYHCRCCFNEVNDTEGSSVYKLDLGIL
ncbi:uncharacterized protein LOC117291314 [Asterias rubens]|uniref:uncharacterized protein LOC117291314 n=1 Tax=Asterias rubens TaxID=7604 RepID=UPI001454F6C9|nr:uncharacterized protein LOC117291314 [Asterias rubens]